MNGVVGNVKQFQLYPLFNWQPMKSLQYRCDVLYGFSSGNDTGCSVLNTPQLGNCRYTV